MSKTKSVTQIIAENLCITSDEEREMIFTANSAIADALLAASKTHVAFDMKTIARSLGYMFADYVKTGGMSAEEAKLISSTIINVVYAIDLVTSNAALQN